MTSRRTRTTQNRRDRRKAKQSKWRRVGTINPKKVAHHPYDAISVGVGVKRQLEKRPPSPRSLLDELVRIYGPKYRANLSKLSPEELKQLSNRRI